MSRIFENLMANPSEISKYGVINVKKIRQKLSDCKPIFTLLFIAGFRTDDDNDKLRLVWKDTAQNMRKMKIIYQILKMNPTEMNKYISLKDDGYLDQQAINAINDTRSK